MITWALNAILKQSQLKNNFLTHYTQPETVVLMAFLTPYAWRHSKSRWVDREEIALMDSGFLTETPFESKI